MSEGHAVEIYHKQEDGLYGLNEERLSRILMQDDVKDNPVMILSVAGALRQGKSFILNFFIKYLECGLSSSWLDNKDEQLGGFSWRGGCKRETLGILMWSKPYHIITKEGRVAVLLMDTQGLYDNESSTKENNMIISMSLLMSSFQVYNVMGKLSTDSLKNFSAFIEFARMAKENDDERKSFQKLLFLVRDWCDEESLDYGKTGGNEYVRTQIEAPAIVADQQKLGLSGLKDIFEDVGGFLLPSPGGKVSRVRKNVEPFKGALKDIDADFVDMLPELVNMLFSFENVVIKHLNGEVLRGCDFMAYAVQMNRILSSGELPEPHDFVTANMEAWNIILQQRTLDYYNTEMTKLFDGSFYSTTDAFQASSERIFNDGMKKYKSFPKYGTSSLPDLEKKIEIILHSKQSEFTRRFKLRIEDLKASYEAFVNDEIVQCRENLRRKFRGVLTKEREIMQACEESTKAITSRLQGKFHHPTLNQEFQKRIGQQVSIIHKNLVMENKSVEAQVRRVCSQAVQEKVNIARSLMSQRLEQKVWHASEIENCKEDIVQLVTSTWSVDIKGPATLLDEYDTRLHKEVLELLKSFENANSRNEEILKRQALQKMQEVKTFYVGEMKKMLADRSWDEQEFHNIHQECYKTTRRFLANQDLKEYVRVMCERKFSNDLQTERDKLEGTNAERKQRFSEQCELTRRECYEIGKGLIKSECGEEFLTGDTIDQIYDETRRIVLQMFDNAVHCSGAKTVSNAIRGRLHTETCQLLEEARRLNNENETSMESNARILLERARGEYNALMKEFNSDRPYTYEDLNTFHNKCRGKIVQLLKGWTESQCLRNRCQERIDKVLAKGFKCIQIELELKDSEKRDQSKRELALLEECCSEYRRSMLEAPEHLNFKERHEKSWDRACCAWNQKVSGIFATSSDCRNRYEELCQGMKEICYELEVSETRRQQRIENAVEQLKQYYRVTMESKTMNKVWSEDELNSFHLESENLTMVHMHNMELKDIANETTATLLTFLEVEKEEMKRQYYEKIEEIVKEYKANLLTEDLTSGNRSRARDRVLRDYDRAMTGGREEIIQEYRRLLSDMLDNVDAESSGR